MKESTKRHLEVWGSFFFGIFFAVAILYILDINRERRFTLYHIRNELRKEMPRAEALEIISRHQTPFIDQVIKDNVIILTVHLGVADSLSLWIEFSDGKVSRTGFTGEDHPKDVPRDAPPNIE